MRKSRARDSSFYEIEMVRSFDYESVSIVIVDRHSRSRDEEESGTGEVRNVRGWEEREVYEREVYSSGSGVARGWGGECVIVNPLVED